ncbi:MAG: MFS transporter [Thermoplasmata archaeon]
MAKIEIAGKTFSTVKLLFMAAAGIYLDGYELSVISLAALYMFPILHFTKLFQTLVLGAVILGTIIGTIGAGFLTDFFGRRTIYIYDLLGYIIFGVLQIVSSDPWIIVISRLFMGIAIGADYPVSNSYIAEIAPRDVRGKYLAFSNVSFVSGSFTSVLISWIIFESSSFIPPDIGWRLMLVLGVIPAIVVFIMRFQMPESQRWENVKGKIVGTEIAKDMFTGLGGKFTILNSILWFLYDMAVYGASLFIPTIIMRVYGTSTVPNQINALYDSIFLLVLLLSAALITFIIDTTGRKIIQIVGYIGMGIFFLLIPFGFQDLYVFILIAVMVEFFNGFVGTTTGMFPAELAKTEFRGSAYGFASMMGKIGALVGVFLIGLGTAYVGKDTAPVLQFFGIMMFVGAALTLFLVDITDMDLDQLYEFKMRLSEE